MAKTSEKKNIGKQPTQAMPCDGRKGAPDGVNASGAFSEISPANGGPYPNPYSGKRSGKRNTGLFHHGGQTVMGYHGTGQLGKRKTRPGGNPNAGTQTD